MKYVGLDPSWKKIPEVAAARKEMANTYREVHKENPAVARALCRRVNAAKRTIMDTVVNSCFKGGTL